MKKIVASVGLVALMFQGCYMDTVDSGEIGVEVYQGKVSDNLISDGLHINIVPMTHLIKYNIKAKQLEMSSNHRKTDGVDNENTELLKDGPVTVLMNGNMPVPVDVTVLYKMKSSCAPFIRTQFGEDIIWDYKMVVPVVKDIVMTTIGKDADIYLLNKNREQYGEQIKVAAEKRINDGLGKDCVSVEMVSIRDMKIPTQITESIMKKNQMEEEARRAELEVRKAQAEAQVTIAKAKGTAEAQLALTKSITPEMIRWKELEIQGIATEKWDGKLPTTNATGAIPFINIK